ncbi:hypothetical protein GLAREA_13085 [Glarea lozoyensis ATCC 20868]|uniref:Uncharacterized protein n=1 Tax=Glarea lozoyensis (strain ATCC 20868 / MF5171) TaxID=1116229 RepID=S3CUF0_GLAL2|nr:uncharacterized protein GLAREA_13085 [Glarea lozoyensis ATCC 20868]EPE30037.1 hypothetical protein GLAREA_13085 [Glarea lozoyensis ATCC 20868]
MNQAQADKSLLAMKIASETVRSAIASAIPVAPTQVLTVSIPGTIINYDEFVWNVAENIRPPLTNRVAEARLVDGMIPLSKFTSGKTGRSVARSYLSTLDLLVPVQASVSGVVSVSSVISSAPETIVDAQLKVVASRYKNAMDYLKSPDDSVGANGRSKLQTYVEKQEKWSKEVEKYSAAQHDFIQSNKPLQGAIKEDIKESKAAYMQWLQEHGRDYKNSIQAKYMDWVVHGYKFMIDFNFGIVDISSGMKRIENSKEAFRNLVLIAEDGVSEYNSVNLTPSNWATIVKNKVLGWQSRNANPSPSEIRSEIRRLENLRASHEALDTGIATGAFFPTLTGDDTSGDVQLKRAYAKVYSAMEAESTVPIAGADGKKAARSDTDRNAATDEYLKKYPAPADSVVNGANSTVGKTSTAPTVIPGTTEGTQLAASKPETNNVALSQGVVPKVSKPLTEKEQAMADLVKANKDWQTAGLSKTATSVRESQKAEGATARVWIKTRIEQINTQIADLKANLKSIGAPAKSMQLQVVNAKGIVISDDDLKADPEMAGKSVSQEADQWTRVSCKVSAKSDEKMTSEAAQSNAVSVDAGWGLWSVSGGASHSSSSADAMSSMSNLEVEIKMDCMVVEIERPWLHAELFTDAELDSGGFNISPGEEALKDLYNKGIVPDGRYQQFSSFPTAMIIAADIELSFSGDTTHLESAVSASATEANVSVGYGPFSVSASHKSSKSKSKTKMESTATGCRISVQAPQIVGWVQTLMPQLPKPKDGPSKMVGLF